jgi:hypothetical protein
MPLDQPLDAGVRFQHGTEFDLVERLVAQPAKCSLNRSPTKPITGS